MVDINYELRTSYFSHLAGNIFVNGSAIPVVVYQYPIAAAPTSADNYLLLDSIFSTNFNDDDTHYLTTIVQFHIVTKAMQNNSGAIKDSIASQLYSIIYPNVKTQVVQIVSGQVFDTKISNDVEQPGLSDGEKKVVNRIISFRHLIKIDGSGTNIGGNIYYGTQDTDEDPVDFSNALNQDCDVPISVDYGVQDEPRYYWLAVPVDCPEKTDWDDLNDEGNSGRIGEETDLFGVSVIDINGDAYTLYMTRYPTGWNGVTSQVKYY